MTIITNNDDDDDDNNTNINDYSVILLKVYFLCFVATELFFPLSPFLKKKEFCKGSCDPLLNRSYWLTHVDVDELYRFFLPVRPALQCLYLAWITVYVLIFNLFDFFERTTFWWHGSAPGAGEGGAVHGCTDSCAFSWFFENCTQTPSRSA